MPVFNNEFTPGFGPNRHKPVRLLFFVAGGIIVTIVMILLFSLIVQWLWNRTITDIFSVKPISFFQSVGILILSRLLFGGFCNRHSRTANKVHGRFGTELKQRIHSKICKGASSHDDQMPDDDALDRYLRENGRDKN